MASLTKKAIKQSFIKLLNERPFDKITIKDIVEDCGVNRNTFYYYYQDIYQLLRDIFDSETMELSENRVEYDSWEDGIIAAAHFAMKNKRLIYHVYNSISREELERYLYAASELIMVEYIKKKANGMNVSEEDIELICLFYKHAVVGIMVDWLQHGMKREPDDIIKRLGRLMDGNIEITLKRAEEI